VLVNKGRKILDGTVKKIKQDYKENLFSIGVDQMPIGQNGTAPFEILKNEDLSYVVRIKDNSKPNDVLHYLLQNGASIHSFNEILPSLNDIFIRLVEGTPTARQFQKVN
jgi:ABC-2 type transport system ATP-binding protein